MSDTAESGSIQLSRIMDFIIGTENRIKSMRMYTTKIASPGKHLTFYIIGSQCDGLRLEGSDVDFMSVIKNIPVIDALCGDEKDIHPQSSYLQACCSPSSSAYTCLELHIQLKDMLNNRVTDAICHSVIYYRESLLTTSSLYLQHIGVGTDLVGPSLTNLQPLMLENDNVSAFHCKTFPLMATEWIHRKRKYSWPSPRLIQLSKQLGYHLVPIGDYNTTMHQFQWRMSFVLQECVLVRSFSHLQMQVYALMKMIKSEVLSAYRSQQTGESMITSYHIKTLMFWTIECTPKYLWCKEHFFLCLRICLLVLKCFVKSNFMPHYFIPQCNLFRKLVSVDQPTFINDLLKYAKNPLPVIVKLPLIMKLVPALFDILNNNSETYLPNTYYILRTYSTIRISGYSSINPTTIMKTLSTSNHKMTDFEWHLVYGMLLSSKLNLQQPIVTKPSGGVKSLYKHYRKLKYVSLLYTHLDVSTGWLLLSSYLYKTHNYEKCWEITNRKVILPITKLPHIFYFGRVRDDKQLKDFLFKEQFIARIFRCNPVGNSRLCKHLASCVLSLNQSLIPCEMNIEVNFYLEFGTNTIDLLPLPYAYFLSFLCSHHLHDVRLQLTFLHNLQSMLQDEHFGFFSDGYQGYAETLNMLGICFELMGDVSNAAYCYRIATNSVVPTFREAAKVRLQLLYARFQYPGYI